MGLMRRLVLGDLDLTGYPFSVEQVGEDHGAPENVYDVLVSMLSDGELSTSDRVTNREITLTVLVEGPTLADLAQAEAALIAECDRQRNTLAIDPGDDYAATSVFDTFRVQARLLYDPALEQANYRRYELTIPTLPYPHPPDPVVTPAVISGGGGGTPSYMLVDDGSATSGGGYSWSTSPGSTTLTIVSGKLVLTATSAFTTASLRRTGTVSLTGANFVVVDATSSLPMTSVGMTMPEGSMSLAMTVDLGSGMFRYFFAIPAGWTTVSGIYFNGVRPPGGWSIGSTLSIEQVQLSDSTPFTGTTRQKSMSLIPGGSVRTQGSIQVAHASNALGKTIVYTHPSGTGYLPPLRPWRTAGETVTTDATLVSGARNAIGPASNRYVVPISVLPEGRAEVWARLRATTTTGTKDVQWSLRSMMGSTELSLDTYSTPVTFAATNTWYLVSLGAATTPPVKIGPSGYVIVDLLEYPVTHGIQVDEAYLFATDEGRLTVVDCGTGSPAAGGASNRLWIDAPSKDQPHGGAYRGNAADRSDAWHVNGTDDIWEVHDFAATGTNVFVATSNTTDAETSLEHYRRYHTHVVDE